MSILEPAPDLPRIDPSKLDMVLCPGLGFGLDGSRLGRGRGYYDRTLAACSVNAQVLGVALPHQIVEMLPVEDHDRFMDHLATTEGIIATSRD
jgi:5-formyltetrahydrofolate cyclo-ligase